MEFDDGGTSFKRQLPETVSRRRLVGSTIWRHDLLAVVALALGLSGAGPSIPLGERRSRMSIAWGADGLVGRRLGRWM